MVMQQRFQLGHPRRMKRVLSRYTSLTIVFVSLMIFCPSLVQGQGEPPLGGGDVGFDPVTGTVSAGTEENGNLPGTESPGAPAGNSDPGGSSNTPPSTNPGSGGSSENPGGGGSSSEPAAPPASVVISENAQTFQVTQAEVDALGDPPPMPDDGNEYILLISVNDDGSLGGYAWAPVPGADGPGGEVSEDIEPLVITQLVQIVETPVEPCAPSTQSNRNRRIKAMQLHTSIM